jgi:hypothetical protein
MRTAAQTTLKIHVPMRFAVRNGRKAIVSDLVQAPPNPRTENALLKALARAHHWRRQIEEGEYASITELAKAKGVNDSYACRLLRLTLLSPALVNAILEGKQKPELTLDQLSRSFPIEWDRQRAILLDSRV